MHASDRPTRSTGRLAKVQAFSHSTCDRSVSGVGRREASAIQVAGSRSNSDLTSCDVVSRFAILVLLILAVAAGLTVARIQAGRRFRQALEQAKADMESGLFGPRAADAESPPRRAAG